MVRKPVNSIPGRPGFSQDPVEDSLKAKTVSKDGVHTLTPVPPQRAEREPCMF